MWLSGSALLEQRIECSGVGCCGAKQAKGWWGGLTVKHRLAIRGGDAEQEGMLEGPGLAALHPHQVGQAMGQRANVFQALPEQAPPWWYSVG